MRTIGLDQSYNHNAIVSLNEHGELDGFTLAVKQPNLDVYDNAKYIAECVQLAVEDMKPDILAIEGLSFGGRGNQTRDLAGLQFVIITHLRSIDFKSIKIVAPQTLKKFATGSGRATKEDMIAKLPETVIETFKRHGYKKTTGLSDLSDAYWLARYVQEYVDK